MNAPKCAKEGEIICKILHQLLSAPHHRVLTRAPSKTSKKFLVLEMHHHTIILPSPSIAQCSTNLEIIVSQLVKKFSKAKYG